MRFLTKYGVRKSHPLNGRHGAPRGGVKVGKKKGGDLSRVPALPAGVVTREKSHAVIYCSLVSRQYKMLVRFASVGGFIGTRKAPPLLTVT